MPESKVRGKKPNVGTGQRCLLLLWPAAGLTLLLAVLREDFAELVFTRGIYPVYRKLLSFLPGLLPFSLGEFLLCALMIALPIAIVLWCIHMIKERGRRKSVLVQGILNALCALGLVLFLFVFGCGANYYRTPYAETVGLEVTKSTQEELHQMCLDLARQAAQLREQLSYCETEEGVFALPYSLEALGDEAVKAMDALGRDVEVLAGNYAAPKQMFFSRVMSYFGITGVYSPFTGEANVNVDGPHYSIGSVMCHELSHTAGFMREDEANYLAYLACTRYGDAVLDYSGTMLALSYSANALNRASPALYAEVYACFTDAMLRDFAASAAYWDQFEDTVTREIGEQVNDAYLKANNQASGTASYGAMVDLLLAEYKARQTA